MEVSRDCGARWYREVSTMQTRPSLRELGLNAGKRTRLRKILFDHGLQNGTALFLPYDQGLEHGPRDFFANPQASDPAYVVKLAIAGEFNGIALQIGLAEKFFWDYAGDDAMYRKAEQAMDAGGLGLIFGRNVWQRGYDESLGFVDGLKEILAQYPSH